MVDLLGVTELMKMGSSSPESHPVATAPPGQGSVKLFPVHAGWLDLVQAPCRSDTVRS